VRLILISSSFKRAYKSHIGKHPESIPLIKDTLEKLSQDPHQPSLETHKLKGKMKGSLACTVGYDLRIVFEFVENKPEDEILLIDIGTHNDVY
jgi:addiction module RelE/StbE family toxin